jgi:hypothetical protein
VIEADDAESGAFERRRRFLRKASITIAMRRGNLRFGREVAFETSSFDT